jgi:hypothetical protein
MPPRRNNGENGRSREEDNDNIHDYAGGINSNSPEGFHRGGKNVVESSRVGEHSVEVTDQWSVDAELSQEKVHLGVEGQRRVDLYNDEIFGNQLDVDALVTGASAGVYFKPNEESPQAGVASALRAVEMLQPGVAIALHAERLQAGAEVGLDVLQVGIGSSGNELKVGGGFGYGGGIDSINGEDTDGDGQKEYGGALKLKWVAGGSVAFRVEPEAVIDRGLELLGTLGQGIEEAGERISEAGRTLQNFVETISKTRDCICELEQSLEMRRVEEASARLQSLLNS